MDPQVYGRFALVSVEGCGASVVASEILSLCRVVARYGPSTFEMIKPFVAADMLNKGMAGARLVMTGEEPSEVMVWEVTRTDTPTGPRFKFVVKASTFQLTEY